MPSGHDKGGRVGQRGEGMTQEGLEDERRVWWLQGEDFLRFSLHKNGYFLQVAITLQSSKYLYLVQPEIPIMRSYLRTLHGIGV